MNNIIEPDINFNFGGLSLGFAHNVSSGSFYTKLLWENKPLFIQTPKSLTKQGFVKSNKKTYCDLLFDINDMIFISWLEKLENKAIDLLFEKSNDWFENQMEKNDIESFFTSPIKVYKSGKYYLLKTNVKSNIMIYNENNDEVLLENITNDNHIISVIEIKGIKFTNKSFLFDFEMKQAMTVNPDPFLDKCYIKKPTYSLKNKEQNEINNEIFEKKNNAKKITETETEPLENIANYSETLETLEEKNKETSEKNEEQIKIDFNDNSQVEKLEKLMNNMDKYSNLSDTNLNDNIKNNGGYGYRENNETNNEPNNLKIKFSDDINYNEDNTLTIHEEDNNNLNIDFEELNDGNNIINSDLEEYDLSKSIELLDNNEEKIRLKNPNEVYYKLYKDAKNKAKELKTQSINAYMEAENIKKTYMLENSYMSDSEDEEEIFN